MKFLGLLFVLSSSFAVADLHVGDKAVYRAVPDSAGDETQSVQTVDVTVEVSAFDKVSKMYTTKTQIGSQKPIFNKLSAYSVEATETSEKIFDECESREGQYETVTVPAGTFKTCHVTIGNTERWIARGLRCADIKAILYDNQGATTEVELKEHYCVGESKR